jgi:UTP--glucose-1-phosphate uridylyltransferase
MEIRKAVVTAAGWGTRFLPATKAQPKETLPLVDKPIIQYVIEEAVASGIRQIIIVTAGGKRAIEDHFDRSFELEHALEQKGDMKLLSEVRRISELADICYLRQKEQLGLGHAILITRELIGNEPFAVFLPDDVIDSDVPCMKQMIDTYRRYNCSVVAVERVEHNATASYGIIEPREIEERVYQVMSMVEKPSPEEAPSNLGIVGRYVLTPEIFEALQETPPGKGREIQLTDGLQLLLQRQAIYAYEFEGTRYDAGNPLGFLRASVELALRRPDIGGAFRAYLKGLDLDNGRPRAQMEDAAAAGH